MGWTSIYKFFSAIFVTMWTRLLSVVSLPRSSTTRSASGHPYNYAAIFKSPILSSSSSRLIPVASTPHKLVLLPSLVSTPARSEPSALFSAPPHSSSEGKLALPGEDSVEAVWVIIHRGSLLEEVTFS
jgi:hypothetical protein